MISSHRLIEHNQQLQSQARTHPSTQINLLSVAQVKVNAIINIWVVLSIQRPNKHKKGARCYMFW